MKTLYIILFIFLHESAFAQTQLIGCYGRQDCQIELKSDSTFFYFYAVDMERIWTKGNWKCDDKVIILLPTPIYDTSLSIQNTDSLLLSRDYKPDRLTDSIRKLKYLFTLKQDINICPKLLKHKKNILYILKGNKIIKKKINDGYYKDSFDPWFTKNKCKY